MTEELKLPWKQDGFNIINSDGEVVVRDVYGRSENDCIVRAKLIVESVNNAARIKVLLKKSNELRRESDAKVYELAEKLRIRTEKEESLDSEKDMNSQLTLENEALINNAARYKEALERFIKDVKFNGGNKIMAASIETAENALNIKED